MGPETLGLLAAVVSALTVPRLSWAFLQISAQLARVPTHTGLRMTSTRHGHRTGDDAFDAEVMFQGRADALLRLDAPTRKLLTRFVQLNGRISEHELSLPIGRHAPQTRRRDLLKEVEAALTRPLAQPEVLALLEESETVGLAAMRLLLANPWLPDQPSILRTYTRRQRSSRDPATILADLPNVPAPLGLWALHRLDKEGAVAHVDALERATNHRLLGPDATQVLASVRARNAPRHAGGLALSERLPDGGLTPATSGGELELAAKPPQ